METKFGAQLSQFAENMSPGVTLTIEQVKLLAALQEKYASPSLSLRELEEYTTYHSEFYNEPPRNLPKPKLFLQAIQGLGRLDRLTKVKEKLISDRILEFQVDGASLDRSCIIDVMRTLIEFLPPI